MPQRKAAEKALRQNERKQKRNRKIKREIKSVLKEFRKSLEEKDSASSKQILEKAYKVLDRVASKKVIQPNKAAQKKSKLAHSLSK
jgi:small subunit ribosomal protein S20